MPRHQAMWDRSLGGVHMWTLFITYKYQVLAFFHSSGVNHGLPRQAARQPSERGQDLFVEQEIGGGQVGHLDAQKGDRMARAQGENGI